MKWCSKCETEKPSSYFHSRKDTKSGVRSHCKRCVNDSNLDKYHQDLDKKDIHHLRARKHALKKFYNITLEDYDRMFKEQGGVCLICNKKETLHKRKYLCIDHNHDTGEVRGLLCSNCNRGLGSFKDSKNLLKGAIIYLDRYE